MGLRFCLTLGGGATAGLLILAACQQRPAPSGPDAGQAASSATPSALAAAETAASMSEAAAESSSAASSAEPDQAAIGPLGQAPGLWRLTQTLPQMNETRVSKICIDAAQGARLAMIGQDLLGKPDMARLSCTRRGVVGKAGGVEADTICRVNDVTLTSHIHADIIGHKVFHQTVQTRYAPAFAGHGDQVTVTDASWRGPCPAGMSPGDFVNRDGVHSNVAAVLDKFR